MDSCLALRIAAVFILSAVSLLGIITPLLVSKDAREGEIFIVIKTGAAGVMLGLCLIHLMPEADEQLREVVPDYPLCYALTCLGVVLVLAVEQITLAWAAKHRKAVMEQRRSREYPAVSTSEAVSLLHEPLVANTHGHDHGHAHAHAHDSEAGCSGHDHSHGHEHTHNVDSHDHAHAHSHSSTPCNSEKHSEESLRLRRSASGTHGMAHHHAHGHGHAKVEVHDHDHGVQVLEDVMQAGSMRDLMTAYALEISTAIHSIIIGVDLGMLTDYNSVAILLAALCFHQFVEGLGLGTVIAGSVSALGNSKVQSFVLIFMSMVSFGVVIGILSSSDDESELQSAITGSATSIAAGSLMYTALTEMAGGCFNAPDIEDRIGLKVVMVLAFLAGVAAMAVIGIWA